RDYGRAARRSEQSRRQRSGSDSDPPFLGGQFFQRRRIRDRAVPRRNNLCSHCHDGPEPDELCQHGPEGKYALLFPRARLQRTRHLVCLEHRQRSDEGKVARSLNKSLREQRKLPNQNAASFWSAPVLWRFHSWREAEKSGGGLPQSKTLSRGAMAQDPYA